MVTSKARKQRRNQGSKPQPSKAPLKAVPQPEPVQAPEPEPAADEDGLKLDMEMDFQMAPLDLLYPEGAAPRFKSKTIYGDPAFGAHWQKFLLANPDLTVFNTVVLAALRVVMREWEASADEARAEMGRVGVPVRPEAGPLLQALREEYRMITAEKAEEREAAREMGL